MKGAVKAVFDKTFLFQEILKTSQIPWKLKIFNWKLWQKIPGPMDNSWFFKARPTFDYILKLTSTKEKQKQLFENKFTL